MAKKQRRKPLGPSLRRSDEDLERLSEVSASDVEDARLWAQQNSVEQDKDLYEPQSEETL